MKCSPIAIFALSLPLLLYAEDGGWSDADTTGETVSISGTIRDGDDLFPSSSSEAKAPDEAPDFTVLSSTSRREHIEHAPPMSGLPPVSGTRTITIQRVEEPDFTEASEPLPDLEPDNPAVEAELEKLRENFRGIELIFVSATVYDESRTFLRIYPDGAGEREVAAWSNLPFHHFAGFPTFRVTRPDESYRDYGLLVGLRKIESPGGGGTEPDIPELPDLAAEGPTYQIVEGRGGDLEALATLERLHALYQAEGGRLASAYEAREAARAARRAELLADPPEPEDVTVRFWNPSDAPQSQSAQDQ